jgi:carnosine N-methyltransferase
MHQHSHDENSHHGHGENSHHGHQHNVSVVQNEQYNTLKPRKQKRQEMSETASREEDEKHFNNIINAYLYYQRWSMNKVSKAEKQYNILEDDHKKLVPNYLSNLEKWKQAITDNYNFIDLLIGTDLLFHENNDSATAINPASEFDMEKVGSTIRQLMREWSPEGAKEREASFGLILNELARVLPINETNQYTYRVLCPGSGLGRLPFEICKQGYCCQGNEWSYFMLITGNYMLNKVRTIAQHTIYPYCNQTSNLFKKEDQFRGVTIPDVLPSSLPLNADFSCSAGDFVEIYGPQTEEWDVIVTCFFLDCANNIIEFAETIKNALKPGGRWINLGPLLYHFADMDEQSLELSYDEIKHVVLSLGFTFEIEKQVTTTYTNNQTSMMNTQYNCVFFSATKPK